MAPLHIAIVPETPGTIDLTELFRVAAAIQRQVLRDFAPVWEVQATVSAFPRLEAMPLGYWPVIITQRSLGEDEGFHLSTQGEPFSLVEALSGWSLTASHEILEMLVDPSGTRTVPGAAAGAKGVPARVEYLMEICDPCQSAACAYTVNDVLVSDFVTPAYYGPEAVRTGANGAQYSFANNVDAPHGLANGGAMTWFDRVRNLMVHVVRDETGKMSQITGPIDPNDRRPARARVHSMLQHRRSSVRVRGLAHALKSTHQRLAASAAMRERAQMFRTELDNLNLSAPGALPDPTDADIKQKIDAALARLATLSPPADDRIVQLLKTAEAQLNAPPSSCEQYELSLVRSALRHPVGPNILTARDVPGFAQYDQEDVRWAKALFEYAIHFKAEFPVCPVIAESGLLHPISAASVLALAGDWGTHNTSSANIGKAITHLRPTHTVHLGDVYYAGTEDEERPFVLAWPGGSAGTFTLNSNHEMYSGGANYFGTALQSDKFDHQTYSYFALSSPDWLFIGLDSAYNAKGAGLTPYDVGHLPQADPQVAWLKRLLASPAAQCPRGGRKKWCLLTHHQGVEINGTNTGLYNDVLAAVGMVPDLWYWGHIHGAAVYSARQTPTGSFRGRLLGHGGIPYISDFPTSNDGAAGVQWAERSAGNAPGVNGFAVLRLAGAQITEEYYDESGELRFSNVIA